MPATANFHRLVAGSKSHRNSILRNLVSSLIIHESITTTFSKAKAVQPFAERVITMGKKYVGRRDQRDRATARLYVSDLVSELPLTVRIGKSRYQSYSTPSQSGTIIDLEDILVYTDFPLATETWRH